MIYQTVLDIPAEHLAAGGTWQVYGGIPEGVTPGKGFMAMEEGAARASGLIEQAYVDENGEPVRIYGSQYRPGYSIFSAGESEENPRFAWFALVITPLAAFLAAHWLGLCIFIAFMTTFVVGAYVVNKITAPQFGQMVQENPDGSGVYESRDGSLYILNPDGSYSAIKGPNPNIFGDLGTIVKYGVIAVAVIGVGYVGMQAYSSIKHKQPFRAPAIDYAVRGVTDIGRKGAAAIGGTAA